MSRVFGYINSYAKMSITYDTDIPDFSGLTTCASYEWEQFYQGMVMIAIGSFPIINRLLTSVAIYS